MSLPVLTVNNIKIYNVAGQNHHRLPEWMVKQHSKKLKKDASFSRRVQLLQDFDFPEASLRIAMTRDCAHVVATGVYKPQLRVFDVAETSLKFERHTVADNVAMCLLGEDWRKTVLLQSDRYVEFHSSGGIYHSTRIPKMGRDMVYDAGKCDLLLAASSNEVYRLNLDRGQFLAPFETTSDAVNSVKVSPVHNLYGMACNNGAVEFWDPRDRRRVGALQIAKDKDFTDDDNSSLEVTAIHFQDDGIHWAAGTSDGRVLCFDIRAGQTLDVKDHFNGYPIKKIVSHNAHAHANLLVSADKRTIKFWNNNEDNNNTKLLTAIESEADINDFCIQPNTGLVMVANDASPIGSYFIPALGPAPRWCSFLENMTEEMEEKDSTTTASVYENFKFVTTNELSQLGLDHLRGTNILKAYMHGFFIDQRLYEKAKAIANPFAFEEYQAKRKAEKLEKERSSRIKSSDNVIKAKINKKLVDKLLRDREDAEEINNNSTVVDVNSKKIKEKKRAKETADALLQDDRFKDLFNDEDFEVDQTSAEYRQLHPRGK